MDCSLDTLDRPQVPDTVSSAERRGRELTSIYVAIATIGRPETLCRIVEWLGRQTRQPDGILVASVGAKDVSGLELIDPKVEIVFSEPGLCRQRNRALSALKGRADLVVFLDDDFVPRRDYLEAIEKRFARDADLVGATGGLIADGIHNSGYRFESAIELVENDPSPRPTSERPIQALYGCNMTIRLSACADMAFDETLPLYGWLEDVDFTYRLAQRGRLLKSQAFSGVHMGVKGGRTSGLKLGYSQIANPIYLLRKKSVPRTLAFRLMRQNFLSNLVRSARPEPHVDRIGRLKGNLLAFADLLRGRVDPGRILRM